MNDATDVKFIENLFFQQMKEVTARKLGVI
jgi:hypothetical protein